jgi:hopene-associated glycosyltransferase HpnB
MLIAVAIFLALIAGLWIVLAFGPWHRGGFGEQLNACTDLHANVALPSVSLIVPARNEASILPTTVPSYCTQDYPDLRVIVVDDQSEDESPKILEEFSRRYSNLTIVRPADPPPGWCGKPWAVHQGTQPASGDLLLFTDADCVFHPLAVKQAVTLLQRDQLDVLSLFPMITFGTLAEQIGMAGLASVLIMLMPLSLVNDPKSKAALAAGGFILVRRAAYEKIGGHVAVKSEIIEDVKLAMKFKSVGAKFHCRATGDLVSTRMYEGFADLWEGLSKNAYAGSEYQPIKFWLGLIAATILIVLPPVYFIASLIALARHPSPLMLAIAALSTIIFFSQIVVQRRSVRYLRLPRWQYLIMPLSAALYGVIAINSAWEHHFRGGNLWKGRRYTRQSLNENAPQADPSKPGMG